MASSMKKVIVSALAYLCGLSFGRSIAPTKLVLGQERDERSRCVNRGAKAFNGRQPSVKRAQRQAKAKRANRRARRLGHA
jgi:hypothetical protein